MYIPNTVPLLDQLSTNAALHISYLLREGALPTTKQTECEGLVGRAHPLVPAPLAVDKKMRGCYVYLDSHAMMACRRQSKH
jgi:hypothetical protein